MSKAQKVLICGTNWLGDSVMSMPGVRMFRRMNPDVWVTMLVRPAFGDLWSATGDVDNVMIMGAGSVGTLRAAGAVRRCGFDECFVFPNSFRSALVPFLAGVPLRRGAAGHARALMLTQVTGPAAPGTHQSGEYVGILGIHPTAGIPRPPYLKPSAADTAWATGVLGQDSDCWVGMLPGAARGPSKQWPAEHFSAVGRRLVREAGCRVAIFGSASELADCAGVCGSIGNGAVDFSGRTTLLQLAALLSRCRCVVSNDSGGMHLAAAVGVRVAAIYGITDHIVTGPMGDGHIIVADDGVIRGRDISPRSTAAQAALRGIHPDRVFIAARSILEERR